MKKVKGAIKTDFILSFEIIVISLSLIEKKWVYHQIICFNTCWNFNYVFVYGIVAFIIKLDDIGFYLQEKKVKS